MTRNRWIGVILFVCYLAALLYLMFFSDMEQRGILVKADYTYNLLPFREIRRYLFYGRQIGMGGVLLNLWGNIIGFLPLGFFLPVFSRRCREYWYDTLLAAYLLSYGIEMTQLLLRAGSCDVDDIILNTLGGGLGYLLFCLVQRVRSRRYRRRRRS
ncbi:VanZ family protein [Oribacterium sp. oral taxon 102]|uniref:VanZ family protein n=1 Tax=Oribacterium sp. oral taxon 102 TaxID=671214 RepID=UPI001FADB09C|nr:VanZ family protein [Oribacterium sp. oral taxon 102]